MIQSSLAETAKYVQEGRISESIHMIQSQIAVTGFTYSLASNLAALHLQLGQHETSLDFCRQAIALDPYSYIAYFNSFLCYFCMKQLGAGKKELHKALSCLYLVRGFEEENIKFLNKSIFYCEQNARAYLVRAKLNEGKNNKLAENDYSAAIQYDPNLAEIYQQRALFYNKLNRKEQFEENLATYLQLKKIGTTSTPQLNDNEEFNQQQSGFKEKVEEEVKEFQELLLRKQGRNKPVQKRRQVIKKLSLNRIPSPQNKKEEDELLLSDRQEDGSGKTITIKKEEIQFKKRPSSDKMEKNYRDLFQDESSRELDSKIAKLQSQIEKEGGKVALEKGQEQELDVSDPNNFLTQEIEKTIQEIAKLSSAKSLQEVKSVKSVGSNVSARSKESEPRELTIEEFGKFKTIHIEVVSLEDIQFYNRKETAKIQLKYGDITVETSMKKYEWREQFTYPVNEQVTEVEVMAVEKGGVFRADSQIGEGTINLLETNNAKCILGNKEKKIAILYFKITLI